ncbi:hypothetical protein Drose_05085 [Dactylosporangium roseum]|uniref:Uncharacterized protein n=1 Tax=Dactylosporangium roseum TaxID=47989 RepID=A0ABY5Z733_9ACTN|nr:hypothetical protein [Dactylosporangium roseum]UWZ37652.1 hypothetical protein Drose_05085 [Dactylosporangium roseum]
MKLYLTRERQSALLAVCPSLTASVCHLAPPSVPAPWHESALGGIAVERTTVAAVVPVQASVPAVASVVPVSALVPSASVAALATGSVRGDRAVRIDGLGGGDMVDAERGAADSQVPAQLGGRGIQVQGTSGFTAKHDMTAPKPNGGVRGIPPRGRPV